MQDIILYGSSGVHNREVSVIEREYWVVMGRGGERREEEEIMKGLISYHLTSN